MRRRRRTPSSEKRSPSATRSTRQRRAKSPTPSLLPTSARSPVAVGLTGGIGAGKSAALESFASHGAATISSDDVVHRLLRDDADVRRALAERFGPEVIGAGGADRAKLAAIVFNDEDALDWLEELLHPRVVQATLDWRADVERSAAPPALTVTEVPLLYETGAERRFDAVVVVTAPEHLRRERRPVPDEREQRLLPDAEKVKLADYAYVNDGTLEELDAFVADVVARLTA